jgi:hypothetical protein
MTERDVDIPVKATTRKELKKRKGSLTYDEHLRNMLGI